MAEIKIIQDDGNVIAYQEINNNEVSREEVVRVEQEIAQIEQEITERNERLELLKAQLASKKEIIAIADAEMQAKQAQEAMGENQEVEIA